MVIPGFFPTARGYLFTFFNLSVLSILAAILFSSCSVAKPTYIFKDIVRDTVIKNTTDTNLELKIQKNDVLSLAISSLNPQEDQFFNSAMGMGTGTTGMAGNTGVVSTGVSGGYHVSLDGNIYLHKLGTVKVAGMTRRELKVKLEKDLLPYLKDPIVTVSFANHFITVMGDVGKTQLVNMPEEKISVIDVIALSGNVTEKGTFKNMLVVRETPESRVFKRLNLEDQSIFSSPWYYLQPKDILVISPYVEKNYKEQKDNKNQQLLSTFLTGLSIIVILLGLFKL
jgi:polysaccharide export outer membrane protein